MTTWWSRNDSWPTLLRAAEQRGISVEILEKDYWVTQSLRKLTESFSNDFVFKGGTSLSKCYRCTQRFSEDIDILILPQGRGGGAISNLMKNMVNAVVSELSFKADSTRRFHSEGRNLTEYLAYPTKVEGLGLLDPTVLLEMGVRGEDYPTHRIMPVEPMIATDLGLANFQVSEYPDLLPCLVPVLHPGRTLVEKVTLLQSAVTNGLLTADPRPTKIGRHYHDIHRLLESEEVRQWLQSRDEFFATVASHEDVNRKYFKREIPPRPAEGYAASDAFRPNFVGHQQLSELYANEMGDLFLGPGPLPSWKDVIDTIQGSANLL